MSERAWKVLDTGPRPIGENRELLIFVAFLRREVQRGTPDEPLTRRALNDAIEQAMTRYLNGERP